MEPFRAIVANGKRQIPDFRAPKVRQIAVPTTLSAGEFNARAGITNTRLKLKQSFIHRAIVPESVILDPAVTVHTPEWLSSGVRAIDHAVETLLSLDANDYTDGTALQALRAHGAGLPAVKEEAGNLDALLRLHDGGLALQGRHRVRHAARRQPCHRPHSRRLGQRTARPHVLRDAALRP